MKKTIFLTSIRNLEISEPLTDYFTLIPGINITNSLDEKIKLITEDIQYMMGGIEFEHLMNSPNLIFCEFTEEDIKDGELEPFLLSLLIWIKWLFRSAWVLFDHSFQCEAAYLFSYNENGSLEKCTSNFLAEKNTLSNCSIETISLDLDALKKWERITDDIQCFLHEKEASDFRFFLEKGFCRSGRAFKYINSARNAPDIGFKIAHYMSAFEALFSTSSSELSHKLSERVAFFLSQHGFNRKTVFKEIKSGYDIRSKLVHGDSVSNSSRENIVHISKACDSYLRSIMKLLFGPQKLVNLFEVSQTELDEYFEHLILE